MQVIYRPPHSEKHRVTTATFFDEFKTYLSKAVQTTDCWDFNIHMDADTVRMCDILSMYDVIQGACINSNENTTLNKGKAAHGKSNLLYLKALL